MYINHSFEGDDLVLSTYYQECDGEYILSDKTRIPKSEIIKWLGLEDMIKSYELAQTTSEKI